MTARSFLKGLFVGQLQPELVVPYPRQTDEERETTRLIVDSFRAFAEEHLDGGRFDREHAVPASVRKGLGELGMLGLTIPEEHGGAGLPYTTYCRVIEECNRWCGSTAVIMGGHQSIGIKALLMHGRPAQLAAWLPRLATGEWMAAYALTEPSAGSDPGSLQTTATPVEGGAAYRLEGQKIWCTNGGFADFITVFARTTDEAGRSRVTCFVLTPEEMKSGFRRGAEEHKVGLRGSSTTQLFLDGVRVPAANVLGDVGRGLKVALEVLNYGRASLAAGCAGASKRMLAEAAAHAEERVQFGHAIAEFELIQAKLAEMASDTYATESMAYLTVGLADRGDPDFALESASCKVFGTEAHWRTVNHAVQVAGGIAYVEDYPYERFLRDARIKMIFEGTNEILRHFIGLAGLREAEAATAAGPLVSAEPRRFEGLPGELVAGVRALEDAVPRLGGMARAEAARLGQGIVAAELVQARLADAAMNLMAGFACASRACLAVEERGAVAARGEVTVAARAIEDAGLRVAVALDPDAARRDDLLRRTAAVARGAAKGWPFDLVP